MNRPGSIDAVPCPWPSGVRSVLVYGGTFDPPHRGHVELPRAARISLRFDWLLYVPAARNPLKSDVPTAGDAERLEMLRAALSEEPRTSICTCELSRPGPSYTIDTLRSLSTQPASKARLRLLIGADQAVSFHRWREPHEIIRLAEPAVMLRTPIDSIDSLLDAMRPNWTDDELKAWRARIVPVPMIDVNATMLRTLLHSDRTHEQLNTMLPRGVLDVITRRGLYHPHND